MAAKKKIFYINKVKKKGWRSSYRYKNPKGKEWVVWGDAEKEYIIVDGYLWHRTKLSPIFRSCNETLNRYLYEKTYKCKLTPKQRICFKDGDCSNYQIGNLYDASKEEWRDVKTIQNSKKAKNKYEKKRKLSRKEAEKKELREYLKEVKKHWGKVPPIDDKDLYNQERGHRVSLAMKAKNALNRRRIREYKKKTVDDLIANFNAVMNGKKLPRKKREKK